MCINELDVSPHGSIPPSVACHCCVVMRSGLTIVVIAMCGSADISFLLNTCCCPWTSTAVLIHKYVF